MMMTAWGMAFLDWNAKWVVGYRGTNELMLALERGEIDMTATGNLFLVQKLVATGQFKIVAQSGTIKDNVLVGRPDFGDAPLMTKMVEGKVKDPNGLSRSEFQSHVLEALNQYLKANRVEAGAASYSEVIRLILGTRFNPDS